MNNEVSHVALVSRLVVWAALTVLLTMLADEGGWPAIASIVALALFAYARRVLRRGDKRIDHSLTRFDASEARRQAHALDLPFLETDGSVSRGPEKVAERDALVHAELQARRWSAEVELG